MKYLFILNDPPYGTERSYNGLRLADKLMKTDETTEVTVFLMADAVGCAKSGQKTPDGYYNLERMLKPILRRGEVLLCGTCMDARGLAEVELMEGARRSSMVDLTDRTMAADKVLVF
ncbi:MAG: DsrE family protein [Actinobacteria bacterium]|nr:DsrE family protein [Actinomycetota bacterium]